MQSPSFDLPTIMGQLGVIPNLAFGVWCAVGGIRLYKEVTNQTSKVPPVVIATLTKADLMEVASKITEGFERSVLSIEKEIDIISRQIGTQIDNEGRAVTTNVWNAQRPVLEGINEIKVEQARQAP